MHSVGVGLTRDDILRLFELLNSELRAANTAAELYLVGGAVMCLALNARSSTKDIDAFFEPSTAVRTAAARVAANANVPANWLNVAVKGFLSANGRFNPFLERSHLRVFVAAPAYLLAMKCAAMRLGTEFHDLEDVRYLLRYLNIEKVDDALAMVFEYFDESRLPPKTRFALEELLPASRRSVRINA